MGMTLPGGRSRTIETNLVPFVDLMTTLLAFLLATAVWVVPAVLSVENDVHGCRLYPAPPDDATGPAHGPLVVRVARDALQVIRAPAPALELPHTGGRHDWAGLADLLDADRGAHPGEPDAVLVTDDGVPYGAMIAALDHLDARGYAPELAGGPARGLSRP